MNRILLCLVLAAVASFGLDAASLGETSPLDAVRNAFVEATVVNYSPDEQTTEKFIRYSDHGMANDVGMLQLYIAVHLPDGEVKSLLDAFDWKSGCWKDIDYSAQDLGRWPSSLHVTRMYALAKLYRAGNSLWRASDELHCLLHLSLNWWLENNPVCPNWWHNEIGVPKKMAAVLLMLRDELTPDELEGGAKVLECAKFGRTE